MRVKRRSRHRKVVKFYSTCFGFREPYKVLVDGTFVHHLLVHQLLPADDALRELLSAARAPPLFTPKCVQAELRRLGKSHSQAFDAAQLLATARILISGLSYGRYEDLLCFGRTLPLPCCDLNFICEKICSVTNLREGPNPLSCKKKKPKPQPSADQNQVIIAAHHYQLTYVSCEHDKVVSAVDCILSLVGDKNPEHYLVATQDSGLRAKLREGPNQLSCKKRKPKPQPSAAQSQGPKADGEAKRKRVRKRKRSIKDSSQAETVS
uniref:UTP23 sensor motif region domain-containing protein n=1 Tax=Aegilops tauschii TaxID=37682 RepID=M8BDC1_AEGTA